MTQSHDSAQENAAASEVLAGALVWGVRSVVPQCHPVSPRAASGRGVFFGAADLSRVRIASTRRLRMRPNPIVPTRGLAVPAGPIIVL